MANPNDQWVDDSVKPRADTLLAYMVMVQEWVVAGDPQAQRFLDADAVRYVDGKVSFHKGRFGDLFIESLAKKGAA